MAIQYYDRVAKEYSHDERNQEVGAKALRQAGRIRMKLGRTRGRDDYRDAIRIYEDIAASYPKNIWLRAGLITTLDEYACLLNLPADAVEADASFRRSLAVAEGLSTTRTPICIASAPSSSLRLTTWHGSWFAAGSPRTPTMPRWPSESAHKAVEWEPDQPAYWNTLGVAQYRAGDLSAADQSLQKSIGLSEGGTAVDWFFLACIRHHQGDSGESQRWYDQAVEWLRQNPVHDTAEPRSLSHSETRPPSFSAWRSKQR